MAYRAPRKIPPLAIISCFLIAEISGLIAVQFSFGRNPFQPNELQMQNLARLNATNDRLVIAPYYYFYDNVTGEHVRVGGQDALTDEPFNNGSGLEGFRGINASWHAYEIEEMAQAEIDVCLAFFSWNPTDLTHENACLDALAAGYGKLIADGKSLADLPKIAPLLNTSGMFQDIIATSGQVDLTQYPNYLRFANAITAFYDRIPAQYRFKYHEDPNNYLVWLDNNVTWIKRVDDQLIVNVSKYLKTVWPGANLLVVGDPLWADIGAFNLVGFSSWGAAASGASIADRPGIKIATIGPGFNNTGAVRAGYTNTLRIKDRNGGAYYNASWEYTMEQKASWVLIESWNNLHDGSAISPTFTYQDVYVNLTQIHVTAFKALPSFTSDVVVIATFSITLRMLYILVMDLILGGFIGLTLYLAFGKYRLHRYQRK